MIEGAHVILYSSDAVADPKHELYLMCDDIKGTLSELSARGVETTRPASDQGWGVLAAIRMPSGAVLSLYEPRHPIATYRSLL
jgi:predicted enzyme related to lactoylglutathione lyase